MEEVRLVLPCLAYAPELEASLREFREARERIIPYGWYYGQESVTDILAEDEKFRIGIDIPEHLVPGTTYWLMRKEDARMLGAVNIRHRLNDHLLAVGGHIGYGVRPSERRKGYAVRMLKMALEKCGAMGIDRALITCDADNIASARTIVRNGGVFEDERGEGEQRVRRYWIDTK